MINTSRQAIAAALDQFLNVPGTCQLSTRGWFNSPSVGDYDGDGDADAVDGWKSEPVWARHLGDRNPPGGKPLAFHGGSKGYGHRCATLRDPGRLRSTDMLGNRYSPGHTSTVTADTTSEAIAIIEEQMGVIYTGWSDTIDGEKIPATEYTRGKNVDKTLHYARRALANTKSGTPKRALLLKTISVLMKIKQHPVG